MRGAIDLDADLASIKLHHCIQAMTQRGAHLLLHLQAHRTQRTGHLRLQLRGAAATFTEGVAAPPSKRRWQRRPIGAFLVTPELPLMELAQLARRKGLLKEQAAGREQRIAEEGICARIGNRTSPRCVRERLRREVTHAPSRVRRNRVEQYGRRVPRRRERPSRVRELLLVEVLRLLLGS